MRFAFIRYIFGGSIEIDMDNRIAIKHLDRVTRSISEAAWLIDVSSEEIRSEQLSESFKARIGEVLIEHLKSAMEDIQYAQYLLKPPINNNTRDHHYNALVDEFGMSQSKA
jgi:hypothetical protein